MRVLILLLSLSLFVRPAVAGPGVGLGEALPEPVIATIARYTVSIHVDREPEKTELPRGPINPALKAHIPAEVREYFRRPPGPVTGLILDRKDHILTTYYNVSGVLKSIQVEAPGGARRPARLVATDKSDDLALLEIEGAPPGAELPELKWADPEKLRVGRFVIAIGRSPDPARPTATFGIVSALGRNGGRAFQTDAELNYGNVGGPITDLDGEVIGMASFVGHTYPLWGLNSGIGFGTTTETIRAVLPTLLRGQNVSPPERAFLGVEPAAGRGAVPGGGAPVTVADGRPAAQAGLKNGDVIVAFGGEKVEDFIQLRHMISRRRPGDQVAIKLLRGGEELEITVRLGKRPE